MKGNCVSYLFLTLFLSKKYVLKIYFNIFSIFVIAHAQWFFFNNSSYNSDRNSLKISYERELNCLFISLKKIFTAHAQSFFFDYSSLNSLRKTLKISYEKELNFLSNSGICFMVLSIFFKVLL